MSSRAIIDAVDRMLRDITGVDEPAGGKLLVFGGDLRQTLPVIRKGSRAEIVANTIRQSTLWESGSITCLHLTHNRRAHEDPEWAEWLLQLGDGALPCEAHFHEYAVRLPQRIVADRGSTVHDLLDFVFPDLVSQSEFCLRNPTDPLAQAFFSDRAV